MKMLVLTLLVWSLGAYAESDSEFSIHYQAELNLSAGALACELNYLRIPIRVERGRPVELLQPSNVWIKAATPADCENLRIRVIHTYADQIDGNIVDIFIRGSNYWETVRIGRGCGGTSDNHSCEEQKTSAQLTGQFENFRFVDSFSDYSWSGHWAPRPVLPTPVPKPRSRPDCHPMVGCDSDFSRR